MRMRLLVVAAVAMSIGSCGEKPTAPTVVGPLSVSPVQARLAVGQSQTFEVRGGLDPIYAQVTGCKYGPRDWCVAYNLDGLNPQPPFRVDRSGPDGRVVTVTFIDASENPVFVTLQVNESNRDDITQAAESASVRLDLVY